MRISDWSSDVCSSDLRQQRLAVSAHDLGAPRNLDVGANGLDPAIAQDDGAAIRILSRRIENGRASDRDEIAARFGEHRLARPAKTGGDRRSRYEHLPKTGHARLLDCLNVTLLCIDAVASHIPTMWFGPRPPCRHQKRLL